MAGCICHVPIVRSAPYPSLEFLTMLLFSCSVVSDSLWPHGLQHAKARLSFTISEFVQTHIHWVSDAIQLSDRVISFSSCLQSFPRSGSFQMSQFFASGGRNIGVSASTSIFPMNIQDWFPLGWTGWISLQSKGLSRVFSNTTVQKHQLFSAQPSLWRTQWQPTPVLLPGKSHGQRSLVVCSPWGR